MFEALLIRDKVLMIGPLPGKTASGQSICFDESTKSIKNKVQFNSDFSSWKNIGVFYLLYPFCAVLFKGPVYFTSSRSARGFLFRDLWILIWAIFSKSKIINHVHGLEFSSFYKNSTRFVKLLIDYVYSRQHVIVAPGPEVFKQYCRYKSLSFHLVPNFFSVSISDLKDKDFTSQYLNVIFLSNLAESKGFIETFEACEILYKKGVKIKLHICGAIIGDNHRSKPEIRKFLSRATEYEFCVFHGFVKGTQKAKILSSSHVLVLPTSNDFAPLSILDGLASGCFIITTKTGSIPSLLNGFSISFVKKERSSISLALNQYLSLTTSERQKISNHNMRKSHIKYSKIMYLNNIQRVITKVGG